MTFLFSLGVRSEGHRDQFEGDFQYFQIGQLIGNGQFVAPELSRFDVWQSETLPKHSRKTQFHDADQFADLRFLCRLSGVDGRDAADSPVSRLAGARGSAG